MAKAYPGCTKCGEHARNLRKGFPCTGCGEMTTVELVRKERGRVVVVHNGSSKTSKSGNRPKSSGRRSDRGDNRTGAEDSTAIDLNA
ncbi:MAG TPA: hypothetical protein VLF21_02205 [Candidatus Saccharimonadales bacterium]|nr:hypothetical protein [Candidatus Saccharimonadales bacterium]